MKIVKEFYCFVCHGYLKKQRALELHFKQKHKGVYQFLCPCNKAFNVKEAYEDHLNSKHGHKVVMKCERGCSQVFYTKNARRAHYRKFHSDFLHKCVLDGCKLEYQTKALLKEHVTYAHPPFKFDKTTFESDSEDILID